MFTGLMLSPHGVAQNYGSHLINDISVSFIIEGDADGYPAGTIKGIGDINADGYDDFAVSAPEENLLGESDMGKILIIFGGEAKSLNGKIVEHQFDILINGEIPGGSLGFGFDGIGDINLDGIDDFAISAPYQYGIVYIIFGRDQATWDPVVSISEIADLTIVGDNGISPSYWGLGYSISGLGDINGDGNDDFGVTSRQGTGLSYLYFGKSNWNEVVDTTSADVILTDIGENGGRDIIQLQDVNNDGYDDFALTSDVSLSSDKTNNGSVHIIFGRDQVEWSSTNLDSAKTTTISGTLGSTFGLGLNGIGDIDGDGYADIAIGAPYFKADGIQGRLYIFFGGTLNEGVVESDSADIIIDGTHVNPFLGFEISEGLDFDNDGFSDFMVGVQDTTVRKISDGQVLLVFGNEDIKEEMTLALSDDVISFHGNELENLGADVSFIGDIDNNGMQNIGFAANHFPDDPTSSTRYNSKYYMVDGSDLTISRTSTTTSVDISEDETLVNDTIDNTEETTAINLPISIVPILGSFTMLAILYRTRRVN
ncbi:MAG: hypothetical protein GPJ54_01735 [Candidatus Heimdallarchaeota archaeon]|nr:hypothetical protein [Candidatus Heimdallarchaeota archaeon]